MELLKNLFVGYPNLWGAGVAHSVLIPVSYTHLDVYKRQLLNKCFILRVIIDFNTHKLRCFHQTINTDS